tara:strand:+ start:11702 stop:12340 length:639 start_codon:yes stop_codon:yes gene_type:complete
MKKGLIAVGIVALGLLVFFLIRSPSSSEKGSESSSENSAASGDSARRPPPPVRMTGNENDVAVPKRYSGDGTEVAAATREFVRDDGTEVRDHRKNAPEPNLERHITIPKGISKVQPETLRAVRLALRPAMKNCIATHAAEAPEGSRAQAVLTVSITEEQLRVDTLNFQTDGLSPETEEALRGCATTAMVGHEQAIAGSPDVEKHVMTFPYDL